MKEITINILGYKTINISNIVLDYNGTLAKDGILKDELKELLPLLSKKYIVHIITADTFGSVHTQVENYDVAVKVLHSTNHTLEKSQYIQSLGASSCVAIGNGNNDVQMIKSAEIGIALLGDEGCSKESLMESDIVCKSIVEALELFIYEKRVIATLRK
jgi:P-type E1-E2 ATPase